MRTILVIDDEHPTLEMFRLHLEAHGHRVLTAGSGEEGLAVFETDGPEIVFTDIKMPGLDGLAVLRAVKERRPGTEVIVITGHGDVEVALTALELRATDFIDKPIRREALEAALNRADDRLDRSARGGTEDGITAECQDRIGVVTIRGSLDGDSEPALNQALATIVDAPRVLLACDGSLSVNGAGLDLLLRLAETCRQAGRPVAVSGLAAHFAGVLDRLGLTAIAPRFDNREQALAHLRAIPDVSGLDRAAAPCLDPSRA